MVIGAAIFTRYIRMRAPLCTWSDGTQLNSSYREPVGHLIPKGNEQAVDKLDTFVDGRPFVDRSGTQARPATTTGFLCLSKCLIG